MKRRPAKLRPRKYVCSPICRRLSHSMRVPVSSTQLPGGLDSSGAVRGCEGKDRSARSATTSLTAEASSAVPPKRRRKTANGFRTASGKKNARGLVVTAGRPRSNASVPGHRRLDRHHVVVQRIDVVDLPVRVVRRQG